MKKSLFIGLAAAMLLAMPVMAEDAVIADTLNFTGDSYYGEEAAAEGANYTWIESTKTLILQDGFRMDVPESSDDEDSDGIIVEPGTTIVVEGDAEITAYDCIFISDPDSDASAVNIELKKGASLTLNAYDNGIDNDYDDVYDGVYIEYYIIGEDRSSCSLTIKAPDDEGLYGYGNITIKNCRLDITTEDEEGIYTENGSIIIENSDITIDCEEDCIDAYYSVAITDSSLDLTLSDSGSAIVNVAREYYAEGIRIDRTFNLYDADGNQLNDAPVEYSADLINFEDGEAWYWQDQQVFRLVTIDDVVDETDTTASITNVFRSLRTVSFSGEGTSALKELCRALGSTVNLNKFVPAAREGYTFTGWYADAACTKPITRLVVTGDMEIYAGWEPIVVEKETEAEEENN